MEILHKNFNFNGFKFKVIKDNRKPAFCNGEGTVTIKHDKGEQVMTGADWNINYPCMTEIKV